MNTFEPQRPGDRALAVPDGHSVGHPSFYDPYGQFGRAVRDEDEEGFDPRKLLSYVLRYRWLILTLLFAGLAAGIVQTLLQTPLYRATTQVEIVTNGAKIVEDLEIMAPSDSFRTFETEREKMLSRDLARRVVFQLNLANREQFLAPTPSFSLMNVIHRAVGASAAAELVLLPVGAREQMATKVIGDGLTVRLLPNTAILSVSYSHPDPAYAAEVANQVVRSYIDQSVDRVGETSELLRQFIEEQTRETKANLQASEKALVDYAKQAGITLTGDQASLISENITELNSALSLAIQERLAAERLYEQVREGNAASLPGVFESPSIQQTKRDIAELKAIYSQKLGTYKSDFPEMQRLQAQISELQHQVDIEVAAIARSVEIKYAQSGEIVAALRRELADLEQRQAEFQDKYIQYTILKREVDSNSTQYESLIDKLNEVGVGSELRTMNASVVDPAIIPQAPYSPKPLINIAAALVLFGLLSAALIYLLERADNTFTLPDQLAGELKLPVLGILPAVDERALQEELRDNRSALSEAYRSLRTSLQFTGMEGEARTLLITSSEQAEGKSQAARKLAHDFAALGKKVLVIDADLRNPQQHRLFNADNAAGLSNLLSSVVPKDDVSSIFRSTDNPRVTLLPAGTIPPNPVELLMSPRTGRLLHLCTRIYDLVIIDGPPVMGLSDAPILSRQADCTLLIVSAKQVTRNAAKMALSRLVAAGGNVVGAALNKFVLDKFAYSYAYPYLHYSDYGYGGEAAGLNDHDTSNRNEAARRRGLADSLLIMFDRFRRRLA